MRTRQSQAASMTLRPLLVIITIVLLFLALLVAWQDTLPSGWATLINNETTKAQPLPVLVNELLAHTDPPQKDTVELYNPNDQPVDVSGWYLSDAQDKPQKFKIPANTIVPAGGYLLLDPGNFDINARFVFSAEGEEIYLFAATAGGQLTGYYHGFSFGASKNGVSFGRYVTSTGKEEFPVQSTLTLGTVNGDPKIGPVVISEILYHPITGDEYIELTNITNEIVPLYDPKVPTNPWRILGIGDYALPLGLHLTPGATLLVVPSEPKAFRTTYAIATDVQIVGPYPQALSDTGAKLTLQMPDPPNKDGFVPYVEVDVVEYFNNAPWPTEAADQGAALRRLDLNAYGNDPTNWTADNSTVLP